MAATEYFNLQQAAQERPFHGLIELNKAMDQLDAILRNLSENVNNNQNQINSLTELTEEQINGLTKRINDLATYVQEINPANENTLIVSLSEEKSL